MYAKYISENEIEFPPQTLREGGDVVINFPENLSMLIKHHYYPVTPEPTPGEGQQWSITASTFELHKAENPADNYISANWSYEPIPEPPLIPEVKIYSKLKIVRALGEEGWAVKKAELENAGLYEEWNAANELSSNDAVFAAIYETLSEDEKAQLETCRAD